jgi:hypothetical protein
LQENETRPKYKIITSIYSKSGEFIDSRIDEYVNPAFILGQPVGRVDNFEEICANNDEIIFYRNYRDYRS